MPPKSKRPDELDDNRRAGAATMRDDQLDDHDDEADEAPSRPAAVTKAETAATAGRGFFEVYKPGQGRYTRWTTALTAGALVVWGAGFISKKLAVLGTGSTAQYLQYGIPVAFIIGLGLLGYRALALHRRVCDFMIATEGEMKKVAWTSRNEIIGSTKVVILVVLALSFFLFFVDIGLMLFFTEIKVLRIMPDTFSRLFGAGGIE